MIYPKFLEEDDTIGICAPSAGVGHKIEEFEKSLNTLKKEGYKIVETESVRNACLPSNIASIRGEEFNELLKNKDINMVWSASGGDFLVEMLEFVNEKALVENPKWIAGYSDPTSLLFHITTNFDIATLYGNNAGSFDMNNLHTSLKNALNILKGNVVKQVSFEKCERERLEGIDGYNLDTDVYWQTPNGSVDIEGRLIGGCIDSLNCIIGTKYDGTRQFIEKYKEDGIIWYFDNFALKAEDLFYALWNMKHAGWFEYVKGFVFGRTMFEGTMMDMAYEDAITRVLGYDVPIIMDADIGHVAPKFTMINGAIGHFVAKDGKGYFEMVLK